MNKGFGVAGIVGVIALLILLGGGGYYLATGNDQENVAEGECPIGQPDCNDFLMDGVFPSGGDEVSPTEIPGPENNWQTYRNEEYGFSFQYPPEYVLDASSMESLHPDYKEAFPYIEAILGLERSSISGQDFLAGREGNISILLRLITNENRLSALDWLNQEGRGKSAFYSKTNNDKFAYEDYRTTTVDGVSAVTFETAVSGGPYRSGSKRLYMYFASGSIVYQFEAGVFSPDDTELEKEAQNIFSTFEFLD